MECDLIRDELAFSLIGEPQPLPPPVIDHLVSCEACREAYREYLGVVRRLSMAPPSVEPPPSLRQAVLSQIKGEHHKIEARPAALGWAPTRKARVSWGRGRVLGAAVALLLAVNGALIFNTASLNRRMDGVNHQTAVIREELGETWRAFSGAPAQYAGMLTFSLPEGSESNTQLSAEGFLYHRPNGWAALVRIEGLAAHPGPQFQVWLSQKGVWNQAGPVMVDEDGVGTFLYYAREPELTLSTVWVVPQGVVPGSPQWRREALVVGEVVGAQGTGATKSGAGEGAAW